MVSASTNKEIIVKKIYVEPVVAGIHLICDTPLNSEVPNNGNRNPKIIRNVVDTDYLDYVPNVTINYTQLEAGVTTDINNRPILGGLAAHNSRRDFNSAALFVLVHNYTAQALTVKTTHNIGTRIDNFNVRDLRIERQGVVDILCCYTFKNPCIRYSTDIPNYIDHIQHLYRDATKEEYNDKEAKAIVEFLSKHQHSLTNVSKEPSQYSPGTDVHHYLRVIVCYRIQEKDINDDNDLTVVLDGLGIMVSKKGLLEAPVHGNSYGSSLLYSGMIGACEIDKDMVSKYGMLIYYNDTRPYLPALYINMVGHVMAIKNIKDPRRKEGFFIEYAVNKGDYLKSDIRFHTSSLEDILANKVPYVFISEGEAEKSTDPKNDPLVALQLAQNEGMTLKNEAILREAELVKLKDTLAQADEINKAAISKITRDNELLKHQLSQKEALTQHQVFASKNEYEMVKHRREISTEGYKIAGGVAAGVLTTLGLIAAFAKKK